MSQRTWFITGVSGGSGRLITEQLLEAQRDLALSTDFIVPSAD
jgi:NAD(P)-dependent dehydrogenase (short-subunit alcohol dehydrogenase family)